MNPTTEAGLSSSIDAKRTHYGIASDVTPFKNPSNPLFMDLHLYSTISEHYSASFMVRNLLNTEFKYLKGGLEDVPTPGTTLHFSVVYKN